MTGQPRPCRYCGQMIVFALTRTTARRPFDAKTRRMYQLSGGDRHVQAREVEVHIPHECPQGRSA